MEIRVLRYFLAVAQEENITRAAEKLHIAQPSLSKQLMELEDELGKQLLIRGKRRIILTEEGVLLRKRTEEILELVSKTEQEITADEKQLVGKISIGGNLQSSVLKAAAALREQHPGVSFQFY
ncbi:MAG: LysR family transcriptional regulator, partial [Eubacteriales bacterium]|nr:LysR family transcriptional regulator [Eubacteriales bacterium]